MQSTFGTLGTAGCSLGIGSCCCKWTISEWPTIRDPAPGPLTKLGCVVRNQNILFVSTSLILRGEKEGRITLEGYTAFSPQTPEQPRSPDVWQTLDITLVGRKVTVVLNGKTVIDNQEIPGITGGALDSHEALPGPIYLQGTEKGHVAFRSIVITPAK